MQRGPKMKVRARENSTSETNPSTSFNLVKISNSCQFQGNWLRCLLSTRPEEKAPKSTPSMYQASESSRLLHAAACWIKQDTREGRKPVLRRMKPGIKEPEFSFSLVLGIWRMSGQVLLLLPNQRHCKYQGQGRGLCSSISLRGSMARPLRGCP